MKAILLFQATTPPIRWPEGTRYDPVKVNCGGLPVLQLQYFRAVQIECGSLSDALDRVREHELPTDNFVNALPLY